MYALFESYFAGTDPRGSNRTSPKKTASFCCAIRSHLRLLDLQMGSTMGEIVAFFSGIRLSDREYWGNSPEPHVGKDRVAKADQTDRRSTGS